MSLAPSTSDTPIKVTCSDESIAPVRAAIVDLESVVFRRLTQSDHRSIESAMVRSLSENLRWDESIEREFTQRWQKKQQSMIVRDQNLGTGSPLDEGSLNECTLMDTISAIIKSMHASGTLDSSQACFEGRGRSSSSSVKENFLKAYETARTSRLRLRDGCLSFLRFLKEECHLNLAVCTNDCCPHSFIESSLKQHSLEDYFDRILVSSSVGFRKPDVRMLDSILRLWEEKRVISSAYHKSSNKLRKEIVMIGDKNMTDIMMAKRSGMRSILCLRLGYSKSELIEDPSSLSDDDHATFDSGCVSYMGSMHSDWSSQLRELGQFARPDHIAHSFDDLIHLFQNDFLIKPLSTTASLISESPLRIALLFPQKKLTKLMAKDFFNLEHRSDVMTITVDLFDLSKPELNDLSESALFERLKQQGPFDAVLSKLTSFIAAQSHSVEMCRRWTVWQRYLNECCLTQFDMSDVTKIREWTLGLRHGCFLFGGNPEITAKMIDRRRLIEMVNEAGISVSIAKSSVSVDIKVPKSVIIESSMLRELKEDQSRDMSSDSSCSSSESRLKMMLSGLNFPVIAKPTLGVSSAVKNDERSKEFGHHFLIVSEVSELLSDPRLDSEMDWVIQEFVTHNAECFKVFVLGAHVYASANDSISMDDSHSSSDLTELSDLSVRFIDTKKVSKRILKEQYRRVRPHSSLFVECARRMSELTQSDCFGVDLIFDRSSQQPFILDWNYFPSFRCVPNLPAQLWQRLLYQTRSFHNTLHTLGAS